MSLQSIDISGFKSGVHKKDKKPFLLVDDAFVQLENAYVWREEVKKCEGMQLIGRYRRVFATASIGNSGASPWSINLLSFEGVKGSITTISNANPGEVTTLNDHNLSTGNQVIITEVGGMTQVNGITFTIVVTATNRFTIGVNTLAYGVYTSGGIWSLSTEPNAELEPGSVIITIAAGPDIVFTDQGNGILTSPTPGNIGYVNYLTGLVVLTHTAGAGVATTASFAYYPTLPAMGIPTREIAGINDEQAIWFDTKYAYIHDGANFQEFLPAEGATWNSTNSDFFWGTNYRGSDSQTRLFFVTNFVPDASNPMRYTDGTDWETFQPIIGGTTQTDVLTTTLAFGSAAYGPAFLVSLPIVEGTVVITVGENDGDSDSIIFRDTPKDGTLVSSGLNTGTINYATGEINLSFNPVLPGDDNWTVTAVYSQGGTFLFTARILIPYYGRLIALNTYEGVSIGSAVNIFNRARYSQIGSPIQQDAWRSDVFGKGGFIDAPVNEDIISATFYKNTLIVFFERSTWRLQYLGEYGLPFIWERISSDFGSESTFSPILFDNGVLAVGDKAIVGSSAGDVQRIDLDIPDQVYDFKNSDNGVKRVHGIRDFKKELAFWCYPDFQSLEQGQVYPNWTLVYNYKNNTFAYFRNNVTCFGNFQYPASITWDRLDIFWDDYNVLWDSAGQIKTPLIASGNQHGFAHFYGYPDAETSVDSTIDALYQESLSVTAVTVTAGVDVVLTIKNHNLKSLEIIYLTGLNYVVTATPESGSTTLNDQIYSIQYVDVDNIRIFKWDQTTSEFVQNFAVTNVGTYVGGGLVALFPRIYIETKDFNPMKEVGQNIKTSSIDFLFDASSPSPINVLMKMNTTLNAVGNLLIGNQNVETANSKTGYITGVTQANPAVITSANHGLLNNDEISPQQVGGMVEINGNSYIVTFITTDTFSINTDSTAFTTYTEGGYWEQNKQQYFTLSAQYAWHRFFSNCFGQFLSIILTYNDEQMAQLSTHQQNFVLNAMKIWYRPGGKNIFGK